MVHAQGLNSCFNGGNFIKSHLKVLRYPKIHDACGYKSARLLIDFVDEKKILWKVENRVDR